MPNQAARTPLTKLHTHTFIKIVSSSHSPSARWQILQDMRCVCLSGGSGSWNRLVGLYFRGLRLFLFSHTVGTKHWLKRDDISGLIRLLCCQHGGHRPHPRTEITRWKVVGFWSASLEDGKLRKYRVLTMLCLNPSWLMRLQHQQWWEAVQLVRPPAHWPAAGFYRTNTKLHHLVVWHLAGEASEASCCWSM